MSQTSFDTSPDAHLQLIDCVKQFRGAGREVITAVNRVNLRVRRGEIVALLGSNGAGKSTILSMIAGSMLPTAGSIVLEGRDISQQPSWQRLPEISRVRQNPEMNVFSDLTIEENFSLAASAQKKRFSLRRSGGSKIREEAAEALAPFGMGLESRLGSLAGTLSGGQRQAVAIAMATMGNPQLLLLDEHVAALDPKSARLVSDEAERIIQMHGITTLMVTHDMAHALERSTRLLMLHQGEIVMDLDEAAKKGLTVIDLVDRFSSLSGHAVSDRSLLT